ncbi:MAG: hypothetical protein HY053_07110 [Proteobacteria bacterium]|nr:hypothetical protein [Pseudomonadota bacterium]
MSRSVKTFEFADRCGEMGDKRLRYIVSAYSDDFKAIGAQVVTIVPSRDDPSRSEANRILVAVDETPGKNHQGVEFNAVKIAELLADIGRTISWGRLFESLGVERLILGDEDGWGKEKAVLALQLSVRMAADNVVRLPARQPAMGPARPMKVIEQQAASSVWQSPINI